MNQETIISDIEKLVTNLLPEEEDIFLVSIRIKPTNNIKIYLDADSGLSIERCVKLNRLIYKKIEELGWYPDGNFSLEVSSPGIDEPLKLIRQYKKNIGRKVQVTEIDGIQKEGQMIAVNEAGLTLQQTTGKNKKAVTTTLDIPFANIRQVKVLIVF